VRSRIALACLVLLLGTARADNRDVAREAFHEGSVRYDLGDYRAALAAFKRAYLAFDDPVFLFNIGQCQRHLGEKTEALRSFRIFLNKVPNNRDRPQVEKLMHELQAAIDQDKVAATQTPTETMTPSAPAVESAPAPAVVAAPPAPQKKKKTWIWGVVAGGVVVVGGAVAVGVVLGTRHPSYVELNY
jgi:tetratricopeptide (TPR) repeat protein